MNQKKNSINKISKQANVSASQKNGYKEGNYQTPNNKNVFKFSNSLNYNSYSDLVDGLLSDKSLSINRNHKFYNINNNKSRNNIRKKNKTNNSNDDTVRDEDDDEEEEDDEDDDDEEDEEDEEDEDEEEEEDDDDDEDEEDEEDDDDDDEEDEEDEEDEDREGFDRKMSTDSIDENNKIKKKKNKNNLFYKDLDKSNKQNNVNTKNDNSDYYDIYSNIYSYYDIFTEGQNGLSKFKYFNNVFSNYEQKGEKNDLPHDQNNNENNNSSNNNTEKIPASTSSYIKASGIPPSFNNPQTRIPNDKTYKTVKNLIKEDRENNKKYTSGQSNNDNITVNRQNVFIDQNNSNTGMNTNNILNPKSQYVYSNKLKEKKNELNKNIGNSNNTKKKIITKKKKKKKNTTEDTIINDRETTFYDDLKRNMNANNNVNENISGNNRLNHGVSSRNNNIFTSYVNKNRNKLSNIKTMTSSFIENNFFHNNNSNSNNNMYKGFRSGVKNKTKNMQKGDDGKSGNGINGEQDQGSNMNKRNINKENEDNRDNNEDNRDNNEDNSDNNDDEEYDNNFSSNGSNSTNLSIDSSCSIEIDYKNDKEVLRNLEKNLNCDKGKGIPKFLKNPAKKRMNKLKKIIEILEYSIYNEERKGNKLEKKLYQYVLLTRNLKKEIYNLEITNNNSKNKIATYEKDIIKLKEQNEEMKLTLSTFENELSNLINKFDKNFAKELIDTKSKNDILKKEVERLKKEIELKNSEIKKIESYNDITKKNTSDPITVTQSDNLNSEPIPEPTSSTSNISNSFITSNPTNTSIPSNSTNAIGLETNQEATLSRNNNNLLNTSNVNNNLTNITSNAPTITVSHEFPFYHGISEEIPQNNVEEFIAKIKNNRIIYDKNVDKYDEETKSAIYGCHISNMVLENPDICNHKKVLKTLQDYCINESRLLNIHMSLKKERCDNNYISQKELEKEVIRQIENMNSDKNKEKNVSIINSIILTLILKNVHIFNLYKIFISSLKYDNFRWIKIIKKALFLKFFDMSLIDFEIKISEPSKIKETKLIHILGGTNNQLLNKENHIETESNNDNKNNVHYNIKHPLFYCSNEMLKRFMYDMYLNFAKEPINPQNNDNIYHYILQKKNYELLKLLKLSGKNYNFIFIKNNDNKTPLDYVENEDIHIDLISGYILDIAGKGAENYKNYRYEQAYQLYSEALEKQIKLSNSIKLGNSKSMNENIGKLYYNRARTLMHLNKWIDAIDNCNNCLKYIPKYINAYDTQIHAYENLLEYENALNIYKTMCVKCNIKPDEKEDKLKAQINATAFQILNINKNSTLIEIKQAFSNLSKKWHPDKLGINTSEDIKKRHNNHFKKLFKAKQLLLNDLERYKEKKKKETNFVYPQIIDDSSLAHRNDPSGANSGGANNGGANSGGNVEGQDKKTNLIPPSDSGYEKSKDNKKSGDIYETFGTDSNNVNIGINKNVSHGNLFNSYKDDIEKFQEKIKNLNKGINNNDNDTNKNINPLNKMFDNKTSNEKGDENFYKKIKEEYERLNDEQLINFKTKISNSINNLIQTEINLKREYQELCNKEKNNAIMNARLCILQEIQKALCIRLDKERKLKIIETVFKDRSHNNKEDDKNNGYPYLNKTNKQNSSNEEELYGDVTNEKNNKSGNNVEMGSKSGNNVEMGSKSGNNVEMGSKSGNNVEMGSKSGNDVEMGSKSGNNVEMDSKGGNNVEMDSKSEKGNDDDDDNDRKNGKKNENSSFDEDNEIEEGYHSRGKYYEYYYDDKNNRYIKEENDEDFDNDKSYDYKKFHEEMQQDKNYCDSKGYENVNKNNDDHSNSEKRGNKQNDKNDIREDDSDNIENEAYSHKNEKKKNQEVSNSNKIIDSDSSSSNNNSGINENGNMDNLDDNCGQNRKRNSKENLNKVWKNEQINELNKMSEKNQMLNEHTTFIFMNDEQHNNKDLYNIYDSTEKKNNNFFENITNTKYINNQSYRNSSNIFEYMPSSNNQYPKTNISNSGSSNDSISNGNNNNMGNNNMGNNNMGNGNMGNGSSSNHNQIVGNAKGEAYSFRNKTRSSLVRNLNSNTDEINTREDNTVKIYTNNNNTFYEERENINIETNEYINKKNENKYNPKERIIGTDTSNPEQVEKNIINQPIKNEQNNGEKKYPNFNKKDKTNEENINDSTNNYYDKDSVYLMYNSRNSNLLDKMTKKKNDNSININQTETIEENDKGIENYYNEDNEINKFNLKNKSDEYISSQIIGNNNNFFKKMSSNNSSRNTHINSSERLIQKNMSYSNDNTKKKQSIEKRNNQNDSPNIYNNNSDNEQNQDKYNGHNGEIKHYDSSFYGKNYVQTNKSISNIKNKLDKKFQQKNFDSSEDFSSYNENNNFYNMHNDEYKTFHFSNEQTDQDINKNYLHSENNIPPDNIKSYSFLTTPNAYPHDQRENISPKKK
ncbi:hypothetical protein Py17XNL_000900109 [Plasmodium yoelii yoelii]|uniref:J domain-containing protein n=1 Tax=Plasmodium yoelii yoelii TaxID=73239 RepID=A0AAF0B5C9_PLAYO|nr:hypothetical protein Py17XNL_000900109 [Plasmodium yoelii yoelii]